MDPKTLCAQEMYGQYPFGRLSGERRQFNRALMDLLGQVKPSDRVYDIGCGSGYWLDVYLEEGLSKDQLTALDLAQPNVTQIKKQGFNAVWGSVLNLPFDDHVSDVTICNGVLVCAADPFRAMRELVRITRPEGTIFVEVYNKWHPWFYLVHRLTLPLRYLHWNWSRKVGQYLAFLSFLLIQPLSLLFLGRFLKLKVVQTHFMDQVITPYCHLFSKATLKSCIEKAGGRVEEIGYCSLPYLMLYARVRTKKSE